MSIVYVIRHAETQPIHGQAAGLWLLSDAGRQQAEALARLPFWNEVSRIFSSPEQKALDTATPAADRLGMAVTPVAGLRELERPSTFVADYEAAVAACFAAPEASVHGWEPAAEAQRRVVETIAGLVAEAGERRIAVVSHGLVLALVLAYLRGSPAPTVAEWKAIPMPGWAAIDWGRHLVIQPFTPVPA